MKFVFQSARSAEAASLRRRFALPLELFSLLLLLALIIVLSLFGGQRSLPMIFDMVESEPNTATRLVGFHGLELTSGDQYRWSESYAFLQMFGGYSVAPQYRLSWRLRAAPEHRGVPLTFTANERELATVIPGVAYRNYQLLLPPAPPGERMLRAGIATEAFSPPGDARELGVIVGGLWIQPVPGGPERTALLLVPGLLALWAGMRVFGTPPLPALLGCGLLAASWLLLLPFGRPSPLPFDWRFLLGLPFLAVALGMAAPLLTRLGLALLMVFVSFSGMLFPSWISDDAFISFRYAQNLAQGHGLVYNVGERVEGYTNFLWTVLAALVLRLDGDIELWTYMSGIVIGLAIVLGSFRLARRLAGDGVAFVTALLVATSQSLLIHTARGGGLETGLFTLLVLAAGASYLATREQSGLLRAALTGLLLALATLTRPEGALVCVLVLGHWLFSNWIMKNLSSITPIICLAAYLLMVLPFFLWRYGYYGDLLPNTFYAKTGGGREQFQRGLAYAGNFAEIMGGPMVLAGLLLFQRDWRQALRGWPGFALLLVSVYSAYIVVVGGDHFPGERFFVPLLPWIALLIAGGLVYLVDINSDFAWQRRLVAASLAILLILYSTYALLRTVPSDYLLAGQNESVWIWRELGWWLADHAAPEESVAALGAGAIAYYSQRTTIDLLGLTDRHIARVAVANMGAGTAGHEKRDPDYVLNQRRPTYIPRIWDDYFGGAAVLEAEYELIAIRTRYGRALQLWRREQP
jgi:arabinofuranosyltransferase